MSAPVWEPGKVYLTGALVRPTTTAPVTTGTITNASFEDGDQDWDKSGGATIVNTPGFDGAWCARVIGSNGAVTSQDRFPCTPGQSITASCMGRLPAGSAGTSFDCNINWYDASGALIGTSEGTPLIRKDGTNWRKSTVTGVAPAGAAFFTVRGDGNVAVGGEILLDTFRLDSYVFTTPPPGLVYKAVQPDPGTSATTEPTWPLVLGQQVVDNTVIWEAVATRRVTWKAIPTMKSGATEPDWPTAPGGTVLDNTIIWTASSRRVEDERCPNSKVVTIAASKIFAVDKDIVAYSATVNPLDWSSRDNAGYLPTGLQQYGANDMAVLGLYGSNLMAFNSQGFQMWQVDEDPANMSLLDARPIGSTFPKAIAPVANDLFFLTELGVRTVGIAGGSTNLQASDAGAPIDPLVQEALPLSPDPLAMFYPSLGQYWLMMREPEPIPPPPPLSVDYAYCMVSDGAGAGATVGIGSFTEGGSPQTIADVFLSGWFDSYAVRVEHHNNTHIIFSGFQTTVSGEPPADSRGILAFRFDGSALVQSAEYKRVGPDSVGYVGLAKNADGVFFALEIFRIGTQRNCNLVALSFDGSSFTKLGEISLDSSTDSFSLVTYDRSSVTMHGEQICAYVRRSNFHSFRMFSFNGSSFSQVASYDMTQSENDPLASASIPGVASDGTYLYLTGRYTYTVIQQDGSSFAQRYFVSDIDNFDSFMRGTFAGSGVVLRNELISGSRLVARVFDGTTFSSEIDSLPKTLTSAAFSNGVLLLPGGAAQSGVTGVFKWADSAFETLAAPFVISTPDGGTFFGPSSITFTPTIVQT